MPHTLYRRNIVTVYIDHCDGFEPRDCNTELSLRPSCYLIVASRRPRSDPRGSARGRSQMVEESKKVLAGSVRPKNHCPLRGAEDGHD